MLATVVLVTRLFPIWAVLISLLAWYQPILFVDGKSLIVPLLSLVMFGMGLTLTIDDFRKVLQMPVAILLGVCLQYSVMPLLALLIATMFQLAPELTIGMILVGASPGGTASNVICYLARGNVALSISLTAFSTVLSVLLTPFITLWLAGTSIDVPVEKMLYSILIMVLLPVTAGIVIRSLFHRAIVRVQPALPLVSIIAILLIIAIIVALNAGSLSELAPLLLLAVAAHNLLGLAVGYGAARALRIDAVTARTLAIEVGMQNSGLAVALAFKYFSAAAALPGALFSIWHNLSGSLLAAACSREREPLSKA